MAPGFRVGERTEQAFPVRVAAQQVGGFIHLGDRDFDFAMRERRADAGEKVLVQFISIKAKDGLHGKRLTRFAAGCKSTEAAFLPVESAWKALLRWRYPFSLIIKSPASTASP